MASNSSNIILLSKSFKNIKESYLVFLDFIILNNSSKITLEGKFS